ncbi:MAG: amidohydrolase [Marinilabiliaceae bacterium]|nr:amidohydrolase [Marinilabiliaceae bacterium]
MNKMKVSIVQQDIVWENTSENLKKLDVLLQEVPADSGLVILPEMFHCGFTMSPEKVAEQENGAVMHWMVEKAAWMNVVLMGSIVLKTEDGYLNRLCAVQPDRTVVTYDKRHLFRMGGEHNHYIQGEERVSFNVGEIRIKPLICYDLRFPVWSRNTDDYDVLIYVANWPDTRRDVWQTLLKARALENQCYVIGVNRVGKDHANEYAGDSVVIDSRGVTLLEFDPYQEGVGTTELDLSVLEDFRQKFPVWQDRDDFTIH